MSIIRDCATSLNQKIFECAARGRDIDEAVETVVNGKAIIYNLFMLTLITSVVLGIIGTMSPLGAIILGASSLLGCAIVYESFRLTVTSSGEGNFLERAASVARNLVTSIAASACEPTPFIHIGKVVILYRVKLS